MNESPVASLIREARDIDCRIKELTEQKTALVERIKTELGVGGVTTVDGVRCSVRPGNRTFSPALALRLLDDDLKMKCVVTTIDWKLVRSTVEAMGRIDDAMEAADPSKTILDLAK